MKTSFYFVLWIMVYPILGLIDNEYVAQNPFFFAIVFVLIVLVLFNRVVHKMSAYDKAAQNVLILEDVYTGDVISFRKRIVRDMTLELAYAIYFLATIIVLLLCMANGFTDWSALILFAVFFAQAVGRLYKWNKDKAELDNEPTSEQCMNIAVFTYGLDYSSYYEQRENTTYDAILGDRPRGYMAFQIVSMVIAIICSLLGLIFLVRGIICFLIFDSTMLVGAFGVVYLLYGSLATYFGVKDIIVISRSFKQTKKIKINSTQPTTEMIDS